MTAIFDIHIVVEIVALLAAEAEADVLRVPYPGLIL